MNTVINSMSKLIPPRPAKGRSWLEKRGALWFSILFHMILLTALICARIPASPMSVREKPSMVVDVRLDAEPQQSAATRKDNTNLMEEDPQPPEKTLEESDEVPEDTHAESQTEPQAQEIPAPDFPDEVAIRDISRDLEREQTSLDDDMRELRMRISAGARPATTKGQDADFDSRGLEQGTIRTLDIRDLPDHLAGHVLGRYGIRITRKYINTQDGITYLNRVQMSDKTFQSSGGSGYYEVFELSPQALRHLTGLERDEILRRKLNPERVRVVKVVFGVIEGNGEYVLTIREFDFQEIE